MKLLLPCDSRVANTQGFAVLNCITQKVAYFQTDENYPFLRKGFRGGCIVDNTLYLCNSFSVKAYRLESAGDDHQFTLLWQLQQPEWLVGRAANADLHALHFDRSRGVLLLANSFMDSVDEISLDGRFLKRQFLWEISSRVRELVSVRNPAAPDLCHINHISTAFGQIFLTLGNVNKTGKGAIVHRETGEFLIDDLERPHDGVFWNDEFWVTETSAYRLRVYTAIHSINDLRKNQYRLIDLSRYVNGEIKFWCRGLHVTENSVFLGCSQFQDRQKDKPDMPPSHILEIDKVSGKVVNRFEVPGSDALRRPVLFSLLPINILPFNGNQLSLASLDHNNESAMETMTEELTRLEKKLLQAGKDNANKFTRDLLLVQNRLYAQLESLSWLQRRLAIKGQLPPLRGWATSPDVLLRLHTHIMATQPRVVVEFGSGASTLVIADALRQNGIGQLISIEHSEHYGAQTLSTLKGEYLQAWVDLRVGTLEAWEGEHLNPEDAEKPSFWYPSSLLADVEKVDLLWVDGPPGATCLFSRYPALPALADKLSTGAEVWMDDTIRQEEKEICESWAKDYGFELKYYPLEKGLGVLSRN
ncbi:Methyltransferase domain-containing protein [Vreelandella titanicae]|uniref:class I SAM-dependent methyltransferase n=1 Tax=Vreelandella titanicae TaxID=664683 RepID=UPI00088A4443|nr:class I SAM-dependent methyltransferase [Halomonas titanicae]SDI96690.1 Methyltransferase domain-containing protein [Halomonas titanicae]